MCVYVYLSTSNTIFYLWFVTQIFVVLGNNIGRGLHESIVEVPLRYRYEVSLLIIKK